jgi:hypothetical protein
MATTIVTTTEYNEHGRVVSTKVAETVVVEKPIVTEYVLNVRLSDSPEWVAGQVERAISRQLRGSMFRGAEIKITRG